MRAVNIMFDTLCLHFLQNYGNDWIHTPNFQRLSSKCLQFENFYGGSMPCMPARRELHTGMYNFLHRSWGPLEPFDFSVYEYMSKHGIYTHLVTDHSHYLEDGGATYHNRYSTWELYRGQEGDRWTPQDYGKVPANRSALNKSGSISVLQHYANLTRQNSEEEMSCVKTFRSGEEFIQKHKNKDNWYLQIESFDPHEPFSVPDRYRHMYDLPQDPRFDWPAYGPIDSSNNTEAIGQMRREYAALLTMCDHYLGEVLDLFDAYNLWQDTILIVNTDHGFLLSEHEWWGKGTMPCYEELIHIPFFIGSYHEYFNRCVILKSDIETGNADLTDEKLSCESKANKEASKWFFKDKAFIESCRQRAKDAEKALKSNQDLLNSTKDLLYKFGAKLEAESPNFKCFINGIEQSRFKGFNL